MHTLSRLVCAILIALPLAAQYPNSGSPIGINLAPPSDWSTQIVWHDMFRWFRGWEQSPDGSGLPAAQLDSSGWVRYLNAGQEAWVGHGNGTNGNFPGGNYLLSWEGDGTLGTRNGASFVSYDSLNRRAVVFVDSTVAWFGIRIIRTSPDNYVRNMHMYMPGFWDPATFQLRPEYENDPWHPDFIAMIERFRCLRFMDWGGVNAADRVPREWAHIKPAHWWNQSSSDYREYASPVAPLWMIRLANRVKADGWFCMPHLGSDELMTQYATLLRDSLDPNLKVYLEFSNECWNWAYPWSAQTGWCRDLSVSLGIASGPAEGYAVRSAQMWAIFEQVFGTQSHRLVKVLAGHSVQAHAFAQYMMPFIENATYNPTLTRPDVLAIAPYIGGENLPIAQLTHEQWFDSVMIRLMPAKRDDMITALNHAAALQLPMVAYEGGQHWVGSGTNAVNFYVAANQHPRMKEVYLAYLNHWFGEGGNLFMHFASCGLGGQYGSWGAMEYYNQPRSEAPKYDALLTFIEDSIGQVFVAPRRASSSAAYTIARQSAGSFVVTPAGRLVGPLPISLPNRVSGTRSNMDLSGTGRAAGLYLTGGPQAY